jgi:uncharacterized protein (TIGR02569 family)
VIPGAVLTGFGLDVQTPIRPVGRAMVAGDVVLKPVDDEAEAAWVAEVLSSLVSDDIRIARPVRSDDGRWVVDGWAAWQRISGRPALKWNDILTAGRALHAATRTLDRPAVLDERTHAWAQADRMAWDEADAPDLAVAASLRARLRTLDLDAQVVHGDLTGNVLFADGDRPGVIDFSPYWRPPGWALAVVVVDAVVWHGAPVTLADALADEPEADQLLGRATLFRLYCQEPEDAHRPWVEFLTARL